MGEKVDRSEIPCCTDQILAVHSNLRSLRFKRIHLISRTITIHRGDTGIPCYETITISLDTYDCCHKEGSGFLAIPLIELCGFCAEKGRCCGGR